MYDHRCFLWFFPLFCLTFLTYIIDLNCAREIIPRFRKRSIPPSSPLIVANPNFNLGRGASLSQLNPELPSSAFPSSPSSLSPSPSPSSEKMLPFPKQHFTQLNGAEEEGKAVAQILGVKV